MIVKEDEARTKLCPMAMNVNDETIFRCRGSACMAWRWSGSLKQKDGSFTPTGFCGMATTPETP